LKKFDPYSEPYEPYKPLEPQKTIVCGNHEKGITLHDYDQIDLSGKYEVVFYDSCIKLYPVEEISNPNYGLKLEQYEKYLQKYEKDLAKYKEELKEWKAQKKIWDAEQKEKELAAKRKQFEQLKKELGET
jgi:hypothetical protein